MKDPKIIELRVRIGKEVTGNPNFKNSDFVGLDAKDKIAITNLMKAEIAANPEEYSDSQVKIANTPDIEQIDEFTVGDAVDVFTDEIVEQVEEKTTGFGKTINLVLIVGGILGAGFAISKAVELFGKKK